MECCFCCFCDTSSSFNLLWDSTLSLNFGLYYPYSTDNSSCNGWKRCKLSAKCINNKMDRLTSEKQKMYIDALSIFLDMLYTLQEDTARVVSTVLLITGLSTLMHTFLGSRLPLIQGASFVYLAPALAIINSAEFQSIGTNVCLKNQIIYCYIMLSIIP